MNDLVLDEKIRDAFEWLTERTPTLEEEPVRPISAPVAHRTHTQMLWGAVVAALTVVVLIGLPLLIRAATTSPSTQPPPTLFATSIPSGEILLGSTPDSELHGFLTPEGIPCLRAVPLDDKSFCSSPELWAIPGILSWQGFWGLDHPMGWGPDSGDAWIYGLLRGDVARVEFQFQYAAPSDAVVFPPHPDLGWASYVVGFDADVNGLFTVVTAYNSEGATLGVFDYRAHCADLHPEVLDFDQRIRGLCLSAALPPLTLGGRYVWPATPLDGPPLDVATAFAEEVLGWEGADITEEFSEAGEQRLLIEHPYASEPLLVSLLVSASSWVYEVSPISLTLTEPGQENIPLSFTTGADMVGIRVDAPVVAGAVGAEVSVRLVGGGQIVRWIDLQSNTDDWIAIDLPNVDRPVVSILLRYVDNGGRVISAVAGVFFGEG